MATNLTNDPAPFLARAQGDTAGWDVPLDTFVQAISNDVTSVRNAADAAATAAASAATTNTSATNLTAGTLAPARIADGSLPLTKLAVVPATTDQLAAVDAKADQAIAASSPTPVAPRVATASTTLTSAEANNSVHMRNTAAATVTVPLTTNGYSFPAGSLAGVARFASDVTIAPYAANTTLDRVISSNGLKLRTIGSVATVETVRRVAPARPTGFWAVLSGAQFDAVAHGTVITQLSPDSTSSMTLPVITPTGTQRPTVHRNASNGRTGISFNGSSNTLPLSGAWLDIFRNRANAQILVTLLVPGTGITGNRSVVSFSVNGTTAPRILMKWRDNGIAGPVVGGRRTDATTETSAFCSTVGLNAPDLQVFGARYVWSSSDIYALRNNAVVASNLTYQTDGTTPDTASTTAAFGSSAASDSEFFQGTILDISIGPDDATLRGNYQTWAELYYGEEALVSGDTIL